MMSNGIAKVGMSVTEVDLCMIEGLKIKTKFNFCKQCGMWIHDRSAKMDRNTTEFMKKNYQLNHEIVDR